MFFQNVTEYFARNDTVFFKYLLGYSIVIERKKTILIEEDIVLFLPQNRNNKI